MTGAAMYCCRLLCNLVCPDTCTHFIQKSEVKLVASVNRAALNCLRHELTITNLRHQKRVREEEIRPLISTEGNMLPLMDGHARQMAKAVRDLRQSCATVCRVATRHVNTNDPEPAAAQYGYALSRFAKKLSDYVTLLGRYTVEYSRYVSMSGATDWSVVSATQVVQHVGSVVQREGVRQSSQLAYKMEKDELQLDNEKRALANMQYGKLGDEARETRSEIKKRMETMRRMPPEKETSSAAEDAVEEDDVSKHREGENERGTVGHRVAMPTADLPRVCLDILHDLDASTRALKSPLAAEIDADCHISHVLQYIANVSNVRVIALVDSECEVHYSAIHALLATLVHNLSKMIRFKTAIMPNLTPGGLDVPGTLSLARA